MYLVILSNPKLVCGLHAYVANSLGDCATVTLIAHDIEPWEIGQIAGGN